MKKTIIAVILAVLMIAGAVVTVSADELPENYCVYEIEGMQHFKVTSSLFPAYKNQEGPSPIFDRRSDTGYAFDLSEKEDKVVTLFVASLTKEKIEKFAAVFSGDEGTSLEIYFYGTDDITLTSWTPIDVTAVETDGNWCVFDADEIENGYSFYRFDFKVVDGTWFAIHELDLFRTADKVNNAPAPKSIAEKEPWRKVRALNGGRLF